MPDNWLYSDFSLLQSVQTNPRLVLEMPQFEIIRQLCVLSSTALPEHGDQFGNATLWKAYM